MMQEHAPEFQITVDQLRPGVFIRLGGTGWFDHPFLFSKFKIRDKEQIALLRSLGITELTCVPEKSDVLPLKKPAKTPPAPPAQADTQTIDKLWAVKRERTRRLREKKERIAQCEQRFSRCVTTFANIEKGVLGGREHAVREALDLVDGMVGHFLTDRESTLHLMNVTETSANTYSHPMNVAVLSMMIGREAGLGPEAMTALGMGALFHDIGKAHLPKSLLRKQDALTRPEQVLIDRHPPLGAALLAELPLFPEPALAAVAQHHERMDGSGTPDQRQGDAIDRLARIVAIADIYDNHCNHADPEKALTPYLALSYMFGQQKHLLDVELLALFIRCLGVYPPGTVVELTNGAIGMVMSVNPKKQLNPSVVLYDGAVPKKEALIIDLADEDDLRVEKSIRIAHLPPEILEYLSPRSRITYFVE